MPIAVKCFDPAADYPALAAYTGELAGDLRRDDETNDPARPRWLAIGGDGAVAGVLDVWTSPDGRHRLFIDASDDACRPLTDAAIAGLGGACYVTVDSGDIDRIAALEAAGFTENRRELRFELPVVPFDAPVPGGVTLVPATDVPPLRLLALDVAIRQYIPGSDGWVPDPVWFQEETFESPDFDPETYLVALDGAKLIGLLRVWVGDREVPRLGCVGVLPAYQRRGIAQAMLARVFGVLHERGYDRVSSDADVTNTGSRSLQERRGATVTGIDIEFRRLPR